MKRIAVVVLLLPLLGFLGCPEDILEVRFNMELAEATLKLSPQADAGTYQFDETQITSNLKEEMDKHGASIDKIKSAKAKEITITIVAPQGVTFEAVERAEIFAKIPSMSTPILLGEVNNNRAAVTVLEIAPADVDLIELLREEIITFSGSVTTWKAVDEEVTCTVKVKAEVVADPL
ncbi:MAG: hypothetical protein H6606_01285 [Flavobacteriales bacterium]|nr:hypothetical protein [Flavobacteriales bacterium]